MKIRKIWLVLVAIVMVVAIGTGAGGCKPCHPNPTTPGCGI